jgi:hypothetical protein
MRSSRQGLSLAEELDVRGTEAPLDAAERLFESRAA